MGHVHEAEPSAGPQSPAPLEAPGPTEPAPVRGGGSGIGLGDFLHLGTRGRWWLPEMFASEKASGVGSSAFWLDQEGAQGRG